MLTVLFAANIVSLPKEKQISEVNPHPDQSERRCVIIKFLSGEDTRQHNRVSVLLVPPLMRGNT